MKRDLVKQRWWDQHREQWQRSGLTRRAYCEREGLSLASFDYWRYTRSADAARSEAPTALKPLTAVPIAVRAPSSNSTFTLHSPSGWRLCLPLDIGVASLALLLQSLP